jgi:DDE family transposase
MGADSIHHMEDLPMNSIPFDDLLTIMYVLIDDWYQQHGKRLLQGKPGVKPIFSDSEVITLLLAMDFLPFPGETQFLGFMRANYLSLFPLLPDQSQFNRRARSLRLLVEELRRSWLRQLAVTEERQFLLDTKPVPVVGYKRSKRHSEFRGSADYGYCASRNMHYFGYKLVSITTLNGLPLVYDLVPASTDEREAAETVLSYLSGCAIYGDKGFIGEEWQLQIYEQTGNRIWTVKRVNQHEQNEKAFDRWLNSIRERIEGAFNEIQNTGRNIERLLAKTVLGVSTRVIAKMTSHALKHLLRQSFGIDVQTFEVAST